HLRNAQGETVAQKDQPPLSGTYPTSLWDPGEIIADELSLPIPDTLPSGSYTLVIGLYELSSGQRLAIPDHPDNSITLTELKVTR
ncbi:MAG: hypothetical protein KDJ65_30920, partial [Anaerolineae bacterium]|nr:hypothetical protein [Anaerolineae bacterium]